jgi:hypothetical protein
MNEWQVPRSENGGANDGIVGDFGRDHVICVS